MKKVILTDLKKSIWKISGILRNHSSLNFPPDSADGTFSAPQWTSQLESSTARSKYSKESFMRAISEYTQGLIIKNCPDICDMPLLEYCNKWREVTSLKESESAGNTSQARQDPRLMQREWIQKQNKMTLSEATAGSRMETEWICVNCSAPFYERVHFRAFGRGPDAIACPSCVRKHNIAITHPEVAEEYMGICFDAFDEDYYLHVSQLTASDRLRGQWKCHSCGYRWISPVFLRARDKKGCPSCAVIRGDTAARQSTSINTLEISAGQPKCNTDLMCSPGNLTNSLFHRFPRLFRELSMKRYRKWRLGKLQSISTYSDEKMHWICKKCYREYMASPYERVFAIRRSLRDQSKASLPDCCPKCIWIDRQTTILLAEELGEQIRLTDSNIDSILKIQVTNKSRRLPTEVNPSCHRPDVGIRMMDNHLIN